MNYKDIEDLKRFKTNENPNFIYTDIDNFMDFIYSNDLDEYTADIKTDDNLKSYIEDESEQYNWQTIKNMLQYIDDCNTEYFMMDGYGWLSNVKNRDINNIIDEIVEDYQENIKGSDKDAK